MLDSLERLLLPYVTFFSSRWTRFCPPPTPRYGWLIRYTEWTVWRTQVQLNTIFSLTGHQSFISWMRCANLGKEIRFGFSGFFVCLVKKKNSYCKSCRGWKVRLNMFEWLECLFLLFVKIWSQYLFLSLTLNGWIKVKTQFPREKISKQQDLENILYEWVFWIRVDKDYPFLQMW